MSKEELIASQQLEIQELREKVTTRDVAITKASLCFVAIGGPLNDNALGFNTAQIEWAREVFNLLETAD